MGPTLPVAAGRNRRGAAEARQSAPEPRFAPRRPHPFLPIQMRGRGWTPRTAIRQEPDRPMQSTTTSQGPHGPHRPRALTVFGAAFVAGAAAAFGVNRVLDVHLAQAKPQVESEPIFVALRSLPQGAPVTVWDVALRD